MGTAGDLPGKEAVPQGEPEDESMDSYPFLDELVRKVKHHYRQLSRETKLGGRSTEWPGVRVDSRQRAAINQWMNKRRNGRKPGRHQRTDAPKHHLYSYTVYQETLDPFTGQCLTVQREDSSRGT